MLKSEIQVGEFYTAKVGGQIVTVQVEKITTTNPSRHFGNRGTEYLVVNVSTNEEYTFRSSMKFREKVSVTKNTN